MCCFYVLNESPTNPPGGRPTPAVGKDGFDDAPVLTPTADQSLGREWSYTLHHPVGELAAAAFARETGRSKRNRSIPMV